MQNIKELKSEKQQRSASHQCFWVMKNIGINADHEGADNAKYAI